MSDDFISVLRADLVDAAARHGRRGSVGRAALPLHPRTWRPAVAVGAVALAAAAAAVVIALSTIAPPLDRVGRLEVVAVVKLGGQPFDATYGAGSLWVADYNGRVLRIDPGTRRVLDRTSLNGSPSAIAVDDRAVWVVSYDTTTAELVELDPRDGAVLSSRKSRYFAAQLAVGAGGVWIRMFTNHSRIARIGPGGAITTGVRLEDGSSLGAGRDIVYALGSDGSLTEIDGASGAVIGTVHDAVSVENYNVRENAIAADAAGAWVADVGAGAVVQVVAGQVVRRISVAPFAGAIARSEDAVWVVTGDALRHRNGVAKIDPEKGAVAATFDFGGRVPRAIVPVGDSVWVIAEDGTATILR